MTATTLRALAGWLAAALCACDRPAGQPVADLSVGTDVAVAPAKNLFEGTGAAVPEVPATDLSAGTASPPAAPDRSDS